MHISVIAAIGKNREIGLNNRLPWVLKADLALFKSITMGHHLIMGRKTFQSIAHPLEGRRLLILSRNPQFRCDDGERVSSFDEAFALAKSRGEDDCFVIGGSEIYEQIISKADFLHLSKVDFEGACDSYFPNYQIYRWRVKERREFAATGHSPSWVYFKLQRKKIR